jgi:hypothetical protein
MYAELWFENLKRRNHFSRRILLHRVSLFVEMGVHMFHFIWNDVHKTVMTFRYAEKRKPLYNDEPTTRRHRTITAGSSIEHDIDTHSVYGFETPLAERRPTIGASGKTCSAFAKFPVHWYNSNP